MATTTHRASLPAGYTIRSPHIDDAAEVTALVNARALVDPGARTFSLDDIVMYWEDPERNLEDEDWLVIAPDGRIVAFMELYEYAPFTVFEFDCHIHPAIDAVGVEAVLYDIIEARAKREMHRAPTDERVVLRTFAAESSTDVQCHLETHGFVHIRDGLQMLIDLDDVPDADWPEGITVRPVVLNQDERAVWEAAEASWLDIWGFAPMPFAEFLYYRIESVKDFDPTLWHLALDGDNIAGVALCLAEKAGFDNTGWVSLLGVRREYRNRGIALALLRHTFADFKARGFTRAGLGVDASSLTGADRLYRRAGMREVRREFIYEKEIAAEWRGIGIQGHRDDG